MGRKGRADRRNLELLRDILGGALHDVYAEDIKDDIREALEVLEHLPGGTRTAPKRQRRMIMRWYGVPKKRPRRPERF